MAQRLKIDLRNDCEMLLVDKEAISQFAPFHCGDEDLDDFFANDSIAYQETGMGTTYCWVLKEDNTRLVGYMTLANSGLPTTHLSNNPKRHLNKYIPYTKQGRTYPGVLIGRLAVDMQYQGSEFRVGSQIIEFLKGWFYTDNKAACRFLIVDAVNRERTLKYYERNGFTPLFPQIDDEKSYYKIPENVDLRTRMYYLDLYNPNQA